MQMKRFLAPALLGAALLGACADDPTGGGPVRTAPAPRVLGLVEITFTGVGTPQMSASIAPAGASQAAGARLAVSPGLVGEGGRTGLQLGARTTSTLDAAGQRYLQAVFQVRNASSDGTAYTTARTNVSFVPVGTASTISGTPVSRFLKQDGSSASAAVAAQLIPTGAVTADGGGSVASQYPDVLQLFTEDEIAGVDMSSAPAVNNRFPYGFVVRRVGSTNTRALPASPAPDQFDGAVTFAYRFPVQANPADNPFTISVTALVVEEAETHVSQSLEEQGSAARSAFEARAASLGAAMVSILPGGAYTGAATQRSLCDVRTAGTAGSATTVLAPCPAATPFTIECTAQVGNSGFLTCGQTEYTYLILSNISASGGIFQFDMAVQNLLNEGIGTPDGIAVDTAGVSLVFTTGPTVTGGSGAVTVANPDGTREAAPFFRYPQKLLKDEVSASKTFQLAYDPGVESFTFRVTVQAEIQPLLVINEVLANPKSGTLPAGTTGVTDANGEYFEVYNAGTLPVQMQGMAISDSTPGGKARYHVIASTLLANPGAYVVLGGNASTAANGGVPVDYAYGNALALANGSDAIKLSRSLTRGDTLALFTLDRVQYAIAATSAQDGISRELKNPALDNANVDGTNWDNALPTATFGTPPAPPTRGTPKAQNSVYTP